MVQTVSAAAQTMRADAKSLVGATMDVGPLIGTWFNAKRVTDHIASLVVTEREDALVVRLYGSSAEPVDWGPAEAVPHAFTGTNEVAGFHARYDFDGTRVEIAANVKMGILVIQTYTSFHDGSDRLSQFSREFFYRSTVAPAGREVRTGRRFLVGDWVNTNANTRWIKGFTCTEDGDTTRLRVQGASEPLDWGETEVTTYLDAAGDPAFHAEYDLGTVQAALAGNTGKDIVIIAAFLRRKDEDPANTFCREFFVPRS
jgi:hypothetical protein